MIVIICVVLNQIVPLILLGLKVAQVIFFLNKFFKESKVLESINPLSSEIHGGINITLIISRIYTFLNNNNFTVFFGNKSVQAIVTSNTTLECIAPPMLSNNTSILKLLLWWLF